MSKQIKKWNIETRLNGKSKTWSLPSQEWGMWPNFKKDDRVDTHVYTGHDAELIEIAEGYKAYIDYENREVYYYDMQLESGTPLSKLTVKEGYARDTSTDLVDPELNGYGFFMVTEDGGEPYKVHDEWDITTVDATDAFVYCSWLDEWDFPMSKVEIADNMFSYTYLRRFRDSSPFHTSLSNLASADGMFNYCCLDLESIRIISSQIKAWDDGNVHKISLYIDRAHQGLPELNGYLETLQNKGWTATVVYASYYR